jgi:hypothetical protein
MTPPWSVFILGFVTGLAFYHYLIVQHNKRAN